MALRFANKIHCIVNNVMSQSLGLRMQAVLASSSSPPRTRYPLNEIDANTYIEQLKSRAYMRQLYDYQNNEPNVVRSFNVDLQARSPTPRDSAAASSGFGQGQRFMSDQKFKKTAGCEDDSDENGKKKKITQCKPGGKADKEKCPKNEEACVKLKMTNCKPTKMFDCTKRPFTFKDCKKVLSPYPSFSEACYEPLSYLVHECKSCPYTQDNHPTFQPPMNKFAGKPVPEKGGKGNKRKFHTGPSRWVTLRFGETGPDPKETKAREVAEQPRAVRPHNLFRQYLTHDQIRRKQMMNPCPYKYVPKFKFKPLPEDQSMPEVQFRNVGKIETLREKQIEVETSRMDETLARLEKMILAKNRIRVIGAPLCNVKECDQGQPPKKKCRKKVKSKVCPTDLLDRKPYKKYREGVRRRREKCRRKQRRGDGKRAAAAHDQESLNAMIMYQHSIAPRIDSPSE